MLGGIRRDSRGRIVAADATTILWIIESAPEVSTSHCLQAIRENQ